MIGLSEVVATPLDVAAREMKGKDAQMASLLNLLEAIVLSYRFQYKDKKARTHTEDQAGRRS